MHETAVLLWASAAQRLSGFGSAAGHPAGQRQPRRSRHVRALLVAGARKSPAHSHAECWQKIVLSF